MTIQYNRWPYGCYTTDDSSVLFDRTRKGLVRLKGAWGRHDPASAVPVLLTEKVWAPRPIYFYDDRSDPRCCARMRAELQQLIDSIPMLAKVIAERSPQPAPHKSLLERTFPEPKTLTSNVIGGGV
jgi:hypothetical protein